MRASLAVTFLASVVLSALAPAGALAQHVVAYDTLSAMTPAAASCGFCAGEKFGVVFYELPGGAGLAASEFPLTVRALRLAVARVTVTGPSSCSGSDLGGTENFDLELYAGETVPTDIAALPATGPWPGETLLTAFADAPIETSVISAGTSSFEATFVELPIVDDLGDPIVVSPPSTYLRAVIGITAGGSSTTCTGTLMPPAGVPLRDDDGRIAPHRSLILATVAAGSRWYWNEDVPGGGIAGDWAVRVSVTPMSTGSDGGMPSSDGGALDAGTDAGRDAGALGDAGLPAPDAGPGGAVGGDGGCGCLVARSRGAGGASVLVLVGLALGVARRRARARARSCPTR